MSVCLSVILWEAKKEIELLEQQTERGECKSGKTVRNSAGPKAVGVVCAFTNKTRMEAGKRNLQGGDWGGGGGIGWNGMLLCAKSQKCWWLVWAAN